MNDITAHVNTGITDLRAGGIMPKRFDPVRFEVGRTISRAIIKRVLNESRGCDAAELHSRLDRAYPFKVAGAEEMKEIWRDEVASTLNAKGFSADSCFIATPRTRNL